MIEVFSKHKILAITKNESLQYHKGKIYVQRNGQINLIFKIPFHGKNKFFSLLRITERLLRLEPRVACVLNEHEYLLSCNGFIYHIDTISNTVSEELKLRNRMKNPLMFAKDGSGNVYFGEYFSNNDYETVNVYVRSSGKWQVIYSFPAGAIYHIHGIVVDGENIYVLTGDENEESAIWLTKDRFASLERVVGGKQKYRACVAFPYKNGLIYATDTPLEENYLYYLYCNNGIWKEEEICSISGPCIYGKQMNGNYYFATSVEPDANLKPMRYRFSYKLGNGVKDRFTHIIRIDNEGNYSDIAKMKKDIWPMLAFQFGNCLFPDDADNSRLLVTPVSVKKYDGRTVCVKEGE